MSLDRRDFMHGAAGSFLSYKFLKSEKLPGGPGGALRAFKRQADLTDLSVILRNMNGVTLSIVLDESKHPDGTIKPSQPISFRWAVYDLLSPVVLNGNPPEDARYASSQITLFHQGNPIFGPSTQRSAVAHVPEQLAHDFYQLDAANHVTAELSATPGGVAVTTGFNLLVVRDNAPSWEWVDLADQYHWNSNHYTPYGILHNNAEYEALSFTPVLNQIEIIVAGVPPLVPGHYPAMGNFSEIPTRGPANATFQTIQQAWSWFDRATLYPYGPTTRSFDYSVGVYGS